MKLLLLFLLLIPTFVQAQSTEPVYNALAYDTFKAKCGIVFRIDDKLQFNKGSDSSGNFVSITMKGRGAKRIRLSGSDGDKTERRILNFFRKDSMVYALITVNALKYRVDINNGIALGEIIVPRQYTPGYVAGSVDVEKRDTSIRARVNNLTDNVKFIRKSMGDAGRELRIYHGLHTGGSILTFLGSAIVVAGATEPKVSNTGKAIDNTPLIYTGLGISFVGFMLTTFIAPAHIRKAGIIFEKSGVSISLHK